LFIFPERKMYRDPHVRLLLVKVSLHRFLRLEKRDRTKKYELVEGEKHAIRTIVHEFYVTEKKMPNIDGIMKRLHDIDIPLDYGRSSSRQQKSFNGRA
jgi:hypothetical protein